MTKKRRIKNILHFGKAVVANAVYLFPSKDLKIIGVTGTDGKTTTCNMIYEILNNSGNQCSLISTLGIKNSKGQLTQTEQHTTTPGPFEIQKFLKQAKKENDSYIVLEVSSHSLSQNRVWGINPIACIITNITPEHLDYHKTFENYVEAKAKLIKMTKEDGIVVLNADDPSFEKLKRYVGNRRLVSFGLKNECDVTAVVTEKEGIYVKWSRFNLPVKLKLLGEFNLYNMLAAFSTCLTLKINGPVIMKSLSEFNPPKGRMNIVQERPFKVIIDFAHTENGLRSALEAVKKIAKKKIIVVFGAAGSRDKSKRKLMGKASQLADIIVLTSEDPRFEDPMHIINQLESGINKDKFRLNENLFEIVDRKEAIKKSLKNLAKEDDIVLITGKGHENSFTIQGKDYEWDEFKIVNDILNDKKQ